VRVRTKITTVMEFASGESAEVSTSHEHADGDSPSHYASVVARASGAALSAHLGMVTGGLNEVTK
jgi:hypothetical protein